MSKAKWSKPQSSLDLPVQRSNKAHESLAKRIFNKWKKTDNFLTKQKLHRKLKYHDVVYTKQTVENTKVPKDIRKKIYKNVVK